MVKIYTNGNLEILKEKTIAVIGYGNQGRAQSLCMRDSGLKVIIGAREGESKRKAKCDGFNVKPISEAGKIGDIIHVLISDEAMPEVYKQIDPKNKVLSFSAGFNIVYKQILPPRECDVIMISPYGTGHELRTQFINKSGVPGLFAIHQDYSGKAKDYALALATSVGMTKKACLESTFEQETFLDLFGEQNVINGGIVNLIMAGFEVLTKAGYPAEMAYFETLHQLRMIADLLQKVGIEKFNEIISNTAEYGQYIVGSKLIDEKIKEKMKSALKRVENGDFAEEWLNESKKGCPNLLKKRDEISKHEIEKVGKKLREMLR